jgi:hypothetical protein
MRHLLRRSASGGFWRGRFGRRRRHSAFDSKIGVRREPTNPKCSEAVRWAGGTASLRFGFVPPSRFL